MSTTQKPGKPTSLPTMHRAAAIVLDGQRADGDERIPIAISSELPVSRWFGKEILDHSAKSIDMTRAKRGLPLLLDHSTREHLGRIEDVRLDDDKVLRGMMRFSRSARGQEVRQDVLDGIRTDISVGYRIHELVLEKSDDETGDTYRSTNWEPLEGSIVPIPADHTVGVGRSASEGELPVEIRASAPAPAAPPAAPPAADPRSTPPTPPAPEARSNTVDPKDQNTAANAGAAHSAQVGETRGENWNEIIAVAENHGMMDRLAGWLKEKRSLESVRVEVMQVLQQQLRAGKQIQNGGGAGVVQLTEREQKQYSYARAIRAAASGEKCFEREVNEDIVKRLPTGYRPVGGFFLLTNVRDHFAGFGPDGIQVRAGLDSTTANKGKDTVYDVPGSFIDRLRNATRVIQAGATVLTGLSSPVSFPKQTAEMTASWMGENPGAGVTLSEMSTSLITLTPKTLMGQTKFSRQLLAQSSWDIENLVRGDIAAVHGLALDKAALEGTGASNQPRGVQNLTNVNLVSIGTNGGAPTYTHMVQMEAEVEKDNAAVGPRAYISTPGLKGTLKLTQQFSGTNGVPVWTGGEEGQVNGYRAYSTNQVSSNLVKGTSGAVCHAVYYGAWDQLMLGEWGAMEILVDPYTLAAFGMIAVTSFQMADIQARYDEAFCKIVDALSAV